MFCPKCGAQCEDEEVFCSTCGASLTAETVAPVDPVEAAPDQDPAPARTHGKKSVSPKLVGLVAVIAVVLVAIFVVTKLFGGGGGKSGDYVKMCDNPIYIDDANDDNEYRIYAGTKQVGTLENYSGSFYSLDGSAAVVSTDVSDGRFTLSYLSDKGVEEVTEDAFDCALSADGTGIVYTTADGELYLYDAAKDKGQCIAEDITDISAAVFVISPDGNTVAYYASIDGEDAELYLSVNGKEPKVCAKALVPLSVTNDGSLIYGFLYRDGSGSLYAMKGEKDEKISANFGGAGLFFNQDDTEILFFSNGKTYYSKNGGEKVNAFSDQIDEICLPQGAACISEGHHLAVSSLLNQVYTLFSGDNKYLYMVKGELEATKIDGYYVTMASGCDKLLSCKNDDLVLTEKLGASPKTKPLTEDADVRNFCADSSLTHIYYLDGEGTLYYQKGGGKAKKIADDVSGSLCIGADGTAYFTIDDALYSSAKGSAKAAVKGDGADDTQYCFTRGAYVYYRDNDGGFYGAPSGGKFVELG